MTEQSDFVSQINMLNYDVANARRQIDAGRPVDLTQLPERMQAIFDATDKATAKQYQTTLLALMAECDALVRDIQAVQTTLSHELRSGRERHKALNAYRSPAKR